MASLFNHTLNPYSTAKNSMYAKKGMVVTSQSLAAQAGMTILKNGGNAVDAAIATAACLTVVEPTSNGIGSDAFAVIWFNGQLYGLNGSGRSPKSISIEEIKSRGYTEMPSLGWIPVTVPGAPGAWAELSRRFGNLPLTDTLKPAINYALDGYPVSATVSKFWNYAFQKYKTTLKSSVFENWFNTFAPNGKAPKAGEIWSSPDHAKTLQEIAETNAEAFYRGRLAQKIASFSKENNGFLSADDLADYKPTWVRPINVNYRGYDVWELPPNGQGIVALQAFNILKGFEFDAKESIDTYHKQIESIKLAFADGERYIAEENYMRRTTMDLLSESYTRKRRALITDKAILPQAGEPKDSGTVYLATADQYGNMVSFIQSNYMGFGSGLVVPGTGIALQNRGHNFSLDPNHVNALSGGKRPYHTIIPGFLTKENNPIGPFGVMGGFMQPQGHVQVIMNTIDFGLHPQAALDAPRWRWIKERTVEVENRFPHYIAQGLKERDHDIRIQLEPNRFGRGQIIWRDSETGVLVGGSESRTDGTVAVW